MAGKIFINYRREDAMGTAGRLHARLAQVFGRKNLFVDVVGVDLKVRLKKQVAVSQAFLTVISPHWLHAKDDAGQRRLYHPNDFVAIEVAAAIARNIPTIAVLVDGARMPQESELPDTLKTLARCLAVEVRELDFDRDAEALIEKVREALKGGPVGVHSWRGIAVAGVVAATAGLLVVGGIGLHRMGIPVWPPWAGTREADNAKARAEAEVNRKNEEAEQQRLAALKAEQERQARAAAEAEARRKSEEAEQQRVAALRAEEDRKRAEAEAQARYSVLIQQGDTDSTAGNYDKAIAAYNDAIRLDAKSAGAFRSRGKAYANKGDNNRALADYNEAIQLDPKNALAFVERGDAYTNRGDYQRAIADFNAAIEIDPKSAHAFRNRGVVYAYKGDDDRAIAEFDEAIRLNPKNALAFMNRGDAYTNKGDRDRAIADYNEAIRLDPRSALALSNRGVAYAKKGNYERALADFNQAIRLDSKTAHAFRNRGVVYAYKGDNDRAIADFNEAIRLDPKGALAFINRGDAYTNKGDRDRAIADFEEAIRLDPNNALAFCNRGKAKRNIRDVSGNADIAKARQLDGSVCR